LWQLSKQLERAHAGEEVIIAKGGTPYAGLVPPAAPKLREPGLLSGEVEDAFFDALPPEELDAWERSVRRLLDTENVHVRISGSSSRLLSRELHSGTRGRSIATEFFPFSFREALANSSARRGRKAQRSEASRPCTSSVLAVARGSDVEPAFGGTKMN
jgi:antitoxin (DNA-binding transcriptional repressor) of toxin-antitoxin stability system